MWRVVAEPREEPLGSSKSSKAGRWGPGPKGLLEAPPRPHGLLVWPQSWEELGVESAVKEEQAVPTCPQTNVFK